MREHAVTEPPAFIRTLSGLLAADPLREKILAAPNRRVGRQWLDRAALAGAGLMNVRISTPRRLLLDFAEPELARKGIRVAAKPERLACLGRILDRLRRTGGGYFSRLTPSPETLDMLLAALDDLDQAGAWRLALAGKVEPPAKAEELTRIRDEYAALLAERGAAEPGIPLRLALAALRRSGNALPFLVMPSSLAGELTGMERRFWDAWPAQAKALAHEDEDGCRAEFAFFAADSAINEAREVLRRLQASATPLDRVEVLCIDPETSVPALAAAGLEAFGGGVDALPFTFAGGIPGVFSRPVRLLTAWLEWLEDGLPAEGLARMLEAGLVGEEWRGGEDRNGPSAAQFAAWLRTRFPAGTRGERQAALDGAMRGGSMAKPARWLRGHFDDIVPPHFGDGTEAAAGAILTTAERLLRLGSADDDKLDAYARVALRETLAEWRPCLDWPGFDAPARLLRLAGGLRVMGLAPLPGRLHIGDIHSGGHSGRERVFIMGLDDSRFPGSVRQDPVFLDRERVALSPDLASSGRRRLRREKAFARLLARLRGKAVLSYFRRGPNGGEQFPAGVFTRLAGEAGSPAETWGVATLAPDSPAACLNRRDDWLLAVPADGGLRPSDLAPWHPDLAEGDKAVSCRRDSRFGEYDGHVPEAGRDLFSLAATRALSPSALELFAANPLEFFFKYVLEIHPPKRREAAPGHWLEGSRRGELLHDLFRDFIARLAVAGETPATENRERHTTLLNAMLADRLADARREFPPRDELACAREAGELRAACDIFLTEEIARRIGFEPLHHEVSLGVASPNPTPWDRAGAVELLLPSGRTLRLKGRIDRVDRRRDGGGLEIVDYKTGRSEAFSQSDPFRQGRHLQPFLYLHMLARATEEAGRPEPVLGFSYFFPMPRDEGRSIHYLRAQLDGDGPELLARLADLLANGCFPFTLDAADVKFSDYQAVYRAAGDSVSSARAKAMSERNPDLAPWAALREGES